MEREHFEQEKIDYPIGDNVNLRFVLIRILIQIAVIVTAVFWWIHR